MIIIVIGRNSAIFIKWRDEGEDKPQNGRRQSVCVRSGGAVGQEAPLLKECENGGILLLVDEGKVL